MKIYFLFVLFRHVSRTREKEKNIIPNDCQFFIRYMMIRNFLLFSSSEAKKSVTKFFFFFHEQKRDIKIKNSQTWELYKIFFLLPLSHEKIIRNWILISFILYNYLREKNSHATHGRFNVFESAAFSLLISDPRPGKTFSLFYVRENVRELRFYDACESEREFRINKSSISITSEIKSPREEAFVREHETDKKFFLSLSHIFSLEISTLQGHENNRARIYD